MGLLALIPFKDWVYIGVIVALLTALFSFGVHERHVQAAKDHAADARVVAAQVVHDQEVETRAKTLTDKALADYKASELQPVVIPVTRIVCRPAAGAGPVSVAGSPAGGSDGGAALPSAGETSFDPTVPALEAGQDADAQVTLLQSIIRSYQAAGVVAK